MIRVKLTNRNIIALAIFVAAIVPPASALSQGPPPGSVPEPAVAPFTAQQKNIAPVEKVSPGIYRLGEILINKREKHITFPAAVNMTKGLLEYLLVRDGGKTHESLLKTAVEPYHLQVACLLLGFEGADRPISSQGAHETPKGDQVGITLSLTRSDGKTVTVMPEAWMAKMVEGKPRDIERLKWLFTGSIITEGRFLAQQEGSIVAVYHDPASLFDNDSSSGENDEIWFVREDAIPPVGTPVTVQIKAGE